MCFILDHAWDFIYRFCDAAELLGKRASLDCIPTLWKSNGQIGLFPLLLKLIPYGENNYQALCVTNADLAGKVTVMEAAECFLSIVDTKWRAANDLHAELLATQINVGSIRPDDALSLMPNLRTGGGRMRGDRSRVAFTEGGIVPGVPTTKPTGQGLGELKMVSDSRPDSRMGGQRGSYYWQETGSHASFRDASLPADLGNAFAAIEEKEDSFPREEPLDEPQQEQILRGAMQKNGICYKHFYDRNCPEGPNCRWSHEQGDFDRYWDKVASDFFRMAGPRIDEAQSQGKLYEFIMSLKPAMTGAGGKPVGQTARSGAGGHQNRSMGGGAAGRQA
jgi:hypothetical protein